MNKYSWADLSSGPISERAIRDISTPAEEYRFFPNSYEAGVHFPGRLSEPVRLYVISGSCKYAFGDDEITLHAAEFIDLERGEYRFEVCDSVPVRLVKVFKLPEKLIERRG